MKLINVLKLSVPRNSIVGSVLKENMLEGRIIDNNTSKPLYLYHIDLMGSMSTKNISGKKYVIIIINDFSRCTFVAFLR